MDSIVGVTRAFCYCLSDSKLLTVVIKFMWWEGLHGTFLWFLNRANPLKIVRIETNTKKRVQEDSLFSGAGHPAASDWRIRFPAEASANSGGDALQGCLNPLLHFSLTVP